MVRNSCGCTTQGPGPACPDGGKLYTAASQAFEDLFHGKAIVNDERWIMYALARLAYIDHLNGWREGDVKVQRRAGFRMVFTRFCGQWIFQFGTKDDVLLFDWLWNRGYQQYVQVKKELPGDQLLGYYRMNGKHDQSGGKDELFPVHVPPIPEAPYHLFGEMTTPLKAIGVPHTPSSSIDLKTQVAIRVAFLVARGSSPLTFSDRFSIQQQAARLLQEHGIAIGLSDERTIQEIIDEAVHQKEHLKRQLE